MNVFTKQKPVADNRPRRPHYSHPNRTAAIKRSIELADEMLALFENHQAPGEDAKRDIGLAVTHLASRKAELERELEDTIEPRLPEWYADKHDRLIQQWRTLTEHNVEGGRAAVRQFLDRAEYHQSGRYALQLIDHPLRADREVFH